MEQNKPITRALIISGDKLRKKVEVVCGIKFSPLSAAELDVLVYIIAYSQNNNLFLSPDIAKQIKQNCSIKESSFTTSIFRLCKKGLMEKKGKTILLNKIFAGITEMDNLLIKFTGE